MRVLHVFKDAFPPTYGGVEQHIWDVARSLSPEIESTVLTSSGSRDRVDEDIDGVHIVRTAEYGRFFSTPITPAWLGELRRTAASVLHLHLPSPLAEAAVLAARPTAALVASFHADVARNPRLARGHTVLQQRLLSRAHRIVAGSPVLAETSPALLRHRARTVVIPYGVDPDEWSPDPRLVEQIGASHRRPIVLFLGRLVHYKGVDVLLEAMRPLDASLLVVGEGPRRPALEVAAAEHGLRGRVTFVGRVTNEERSAYYQAASVFVLPAVSRAESFGIAMLEAMSHGTPAVCTEVGTGTSWVNLAGETGLVVPPGDSTALAEAIRTLLEDDRLRLRLGAAAAHRARERFSKRAMLERLAALYGSLGGPVEESSRRGRR
jgi:glycosyltransferase involved in cell wall biosynthesis